MVCKSLTAPCSHTAPTGMGDIGHKGVLVARGSGTEVGDTLEVRPPSEIPF